MVTVLTSDSFEKEVLAEQLPVIIDFYADWCGPCQAMRPIVEEVSDELDGRVKFCACNVDENADLAMKYGIMGIPCFIHMNKAQYIDKLVGQVSREEFLAFAKKADPLCSIFNKRTC